MGVNNIMECKTYENKVPIRFDIKMLNAFIGLIFKKSTQVTRKSLRNLKSLFDVIDRTVYSENEKLEARFEFIQRALDAKIDKGFENEDAIINYCRMDVYNKENDEIIKNIPLYTKLNYEELKSINKAVEDRLQFYFIYNYKNMIYAAVERLDSGDYKCFAEINNELVNICTKVLSDVRRTRNVDQTNTFSLADETFNNVIPEIVSSLKDPSRILSTGIQRLNEILSPGYIGKRLYVYMGLPAGFKSGILLKSAIDIKKYNMNIQPKKPGKRPAVLLITMENSVEETVERLFNMVGPSNDIRTYTSKQIIKILRNDGELKLTDENNIDIIIKYYPNRSISTSDVYTIIDDLLDDGIEVIALILDYIKRIRPAERAKDEKEELKNVTNELKTIASEYDIPVITAHQLNRSGAMVVDAAMQSDKEDLARYLGRSNVGSAWEVMENSDFVCIINIEKKKNTNSYYLTFKRVKLRYKSITDLTYFNHPFEIDNSIKLKDDVYLDSPLSEASLSVEFEGIDMTSKKGKRTATKREILEEEDDTAFFNFNKSINT
jgi:replicative DNA helicase